MNGALRHLPLHADLVPRASGDSKRRYLAFVCGASALGAVLAVSGCHTPAAPFDPFLAGRSTIPPPGTAVQAGQAPYYSGAAPAVTVPAPAAGYTSPGAVPTAVPAAVPAVSIPSTGGGQLPRGISAPQSSTQTPAGNTQLAVWQSSGEADLRAEAESAPGKKPNEDKTRTNTPFANIAGRGARQSDDATANRSGVVRASFDQPGNEAPIRIVEPASQSPKATSGGNALTKASPKTPAVARPGESEESGSQPLPELTDFPPANGRPAARWKAGF